MKKEIIIILFFILSQLNVTSQDIWIPKSDFLGGERFNAVAFSIGNKGYVGLGNNFTTSFDDFWEYDASNDTWNQISNFPDGTRIGAVGFSIGDKGYVGAGINDTGTYMNDFWEYDTLNNHWTQKSSIGNFGRVSAVGFSIGDKGYLGTGERDLMANYYLNDFWQYNPDSDTWIRKADFLGSPRSNAACFSIRGNGYICTGEDDSNFFSNNELWKYDTLTNSWSLMASLPAQPRRGAVGFSSDSSGFLCTGFYSLFSLTLNDFWEYFPDSNLWKQLSDFQGLPRTEAVGFTINGIQYIGTGACCSNQSLSDWWKNLPDTSNNIFATDFLYSDIIIYPNPSSGIFYLKSNRDIGKEINISIYDCSGVKILDLNELISSYNKINLLGFSKGIYYLKIESNYIHSFKKLLII